MRLRVSLCETPSESLSPGEIFADNARLTPPGGWPAPSAFMDSETPRDPYLVKSVVHSSRVLSAFRASGEALPLREIAARSGLPKSMVVPSALHARTLRHGRKGRRKPLSIVRAAVQAEALSPGYAAQGTDYQFSKEISTGLQRAAAAEGIELICLDNRYSAKIAQRNADVFVREKVDLVIEFQTDEHVAPIVAAKYREANIPLIAIEIPHPGATYFGANNYEAGLIGGRYLGRWAKQQWQSNVDEIVLITLERAGSLPRMRLTGMLVGMRDACPALEHVPVTYVDGDGKMADTFEAMRRHLRTTKSRRHARRRHQRSQCAWRSARISGEPAAPHACAIMGQNASPEGRAELREPGTRLIGSVAYFPEKYGPEIVAVALDILHRRPVPPAVFVKHQLVTPENVNHVYPNDELIPLPVSGPS